MILYLDTSALVKLYVEEAHSDDVREWVDDAEIVATAGSHIPRPCRRCIGACGPVTFRKPRTEPRSGHFGEIGIDSRSSILMSSTRGDWCRNTACGDTMPFTSRQPR